MVELMMSRGKYGRDTVRQETEHFHKPSSFFSHFFVNNWYIFHVQERTTSR